MEEDVDEPASTSQSADGLQSVEIQLYPLDIHMGDCSPQTQAATTFKVPNKEYEENKRAKPNPKRRPDSDILSEEICSEKKKAKSNQEQGKGKQSSEPSPRLVMS